MKKVVAMVTVAIVVMLNLVSCKNSASLESITEDFVSDIFTYPSDAFIEYRELLEKGEMTELGDNISVLTGNKEVIEESLVRLYSGKVSSELTTEKVISDPVVSLHMGENNFTMTPINITIDKSSSKGIYTFEAELELDDGTKQIINVSGKVQFDEQNKITYFETNGDHVNFDCC